MKVYFLEADVPLTKTFNMTDGKLVKIGHPQILNYTSHAEEVITIEDLHAAIVKHAALGHCMLKGPLNRPLVKESRSGSTNTNDPSEILCYDMDGLKGFNNVDDALKQLNAANVDHIIQYSSSMGVTPDKGVSCHVFALATATNMAPAMKQWLIAENLRIPQFRQDIALTRTNNALRWPLDITTCQNDKLIYIADPILGKGVVDKFKGTRIKLVKRKLRKFEMPTTTSAEANKVAQQTLLNELRKKAGLEPRKTTIMKYAGPVEYMVNPDQATVTGIKTERGFVYLNLNGGDSWAYYHREGNPEFIYNFKGDPIYKTSELLPDYWRSVRPKPTARDDADIQYLAFRDFNTAVYYNGTWDPNDEILDVKPARSETQLKSFLKQYGQPVGEFVPDWRTRFDPNSDEIINTEKQTINWFTPTKYMLMEPDKKARIPATMRKVMFHALGNDQECFDHMINWLACLLQHRKKLGTSWVMNGIQGTGKGLFLNKILKPLFRYVAVKRTRELDTQFNGWAEKSLILWVDEAEIAVHNSSNEIEGDLKNYIVEPTISIRNMYMTSYDVDSYLNILLASNKGEIIHIDPSDRRFNVAPFQPNKIELTEDEIDVSLPAELDEMAQFLLAYDADLVQARTALNNEAKQLQMHMSESSIDGICRAILAGNFKMLADEKPDDHLATGNTSRDITAGAYIRLMNEIEAGKKPVLLRGDLFTILDWTCGGVPAASYKLASYLKHYGIHLRNVTHAGKSLRGVKVEWKI